MADGVEHMTRLETASETRLPHLATRAATCKLESTVARDVLAIPADLTAIPWSSGSRNPGIRGS